MPRRVINNECVKSIDRKSYGLILVLKKCEKIKDKSLMNEKVQKVKFLIKFTNEKICLQIKDCQKSLTVE